MHHYMRTDLLESLAAVGLYPLLLFVPGYVIAWLADLFAFRRRTPAFRIALSIPLSISTCPILIYLAGRFASITVAGGIIAITWICFAVLLMRYGLGWPRLPRLGWGVVLAWLTITLFVSVDLQIGAKDYYPVTAFDYAVRSEFIHSIGTTGVPPANPFFFPGHAEPLRYHYFWLLPAGLMYRATGYVISPRAAWIGSVFWSGLGFVSLIAITFRVFWYSGRARFRRHAITGVLLVGVTGLDILPTAFLWLLRAKGLLFAVLVSVEVWNDQVDGFVFTALWEAHHLSGLTTCILAFLLLHEGSQEARPVRRIVYAGVAGLALANAVGASIYITFVFAVYLVIWTAIVIVKGWRNSAGVLVMAGITAITLALPYVLSLRSNAPGGPFVVFRIRPFYPMYVLLKAQGITAASIRSLLNLAMLPLNYFLELGFFLGAAVIWWRKRRATGKALSERELAIAVLTATSILICTFLRSSVISNNDLGWRGFLPAQFGLLLWAADVLIEQPRGRLLSAMLILGAAGTAYDLAILRLYPVLADAGVVAHRTWVAPQDAGLHNYSAREAYEWIARSTPPGAVIQFDPHVSIQDTSALLYGARQIAAADPHCLTVFGGDSPSCAPIVAALGPIYPPKGSPAELNLQEACRTVAVDVFVAKDSDSVWADPRSWVWNEKPVFANDFFRVFRCHKPAEVRTSRN